MKKIILPQGMGKTALLIKLSEQTGKYIVCLDRKRVGIIWKMALENKISIPMPVTLEEIRNIRGSSINRDGVLVDDMDDIVKNLLSEAFGGIEIDTATFSDDRI